MPRDLRNVAGGDKRGDFKREMMCGRVAKIPISNTFDGLVDMDFVDYGGYANFLHIRDSFSRFSVVVRTGAKRKGVETAEMFREAAISHWMAAFGGAWNYRIG